MLATPRVERNIELTHSVRDGRTVRVGNIDWDTRGPSIVEPFSMFRWAQPADDPFRVSSRSHLVVYRTVAEGKTKAASRAPGIVTFDE